MLSWTPTAAQLGEHAVAVQASDGRGGLALQEFVVVVNAATPTESEIAPPPLLRLAVATDAATYLAGGVAALTATVTNDQAFGRAGELDLQILDAGGAVIATPLQGESVVFTGPGARDGARHLLHRADTTGGVHGAARRSARAPPPAPPAPGSRSSPRRGWPPRWSPTAGSTGPTKR